MMLRMELGLGKERGNLNQPEILVDGDRDCMPTTSW